MTARTARGVPRVQEISASASMMRTLAGRWPDKYPALLESVAAGERARFSILFGTPSAALWRTPADGVFHDGEPLGSATFFGTLQRLSSAMPRSASATTPDGTRLPFCGGWLVLLGYELANEVEPVLTLPRSRLPFDALALQISIAVIWDHRSQRLYAVAAAERHDLIDGLCEDILTCQSSLQAGRLQPDFSADATQTFAIHEEPPQLFLERVARAKDYIAAGDVYQANLSRAWRSRQPRGVSIVELYERLCASNPAPFAALVQWQGVAIVSSSPERLLQLDGREISTRPIAGTRRRAEGADSQDDAADREALVAHPKERAEHIMLIDLERNDLGRVCEAGSVTVDELMVIESYAHVHHIVSNVRGRLRADVTPIDALLAVFPGGTITGCPKIRCMQIIAALEQEGRGFYTGSLGYLSADGQADFNILIRTLTIHADEIELRAGAGIVADSIPEQELAETRAKAHGLLLALEHVS
ncbi:MAG: aminodeoxychorismate synthase component I [Proteobacteria bacterium]|nr:aminodeoxychorismate synthase component I [Pseudomonadota bacterium]